MRCAVDRLSLRPGEVSLLQNCRSDQDALIVRIPDAVLNASPPTGAKTSGGAYFPMGDFQGFLNGTAYWLSAWQMTSGGTAIFSQNLTTGAYTEITDPGNATPTTWGGDSTGSTRFPTQSARVMYCPQASPRRVSQGTAVQTLDVLVIVNGEDQNMVWNPGNGLGYQAQLFWSTPIILPSTPDVFHTLASLSSFWAVRGDSGADGSNKKVYTNSAGPPKINQANFKLANTTTVYGASDATLRVILWTIDVLVGSGDIATVRFPVSGVSGRETFSGKWLYIIFEGATSDINMMLKDSRVDIGKENVAYGSVSTWTTLYDPTSTDASVSTLPPPVQLDPSTQRWVYFFNLQNVPSANRTAYHLRFVRTSAYVPGALDFVKILCIGSTGKGGGFPYATEWTAVYSDHFTQAESAPIVMSRTDMDLLVNCGGPRAPDANINTGGVIVLPRDTSMWYDYRMKVKMPDSNTAIPGGLQGQPSHVDFYFRNPATETTPFYWSSWQIWAFSLVNFTWVTQASAGAGGTETLNTEQVQTPSTSPDGFGYGVFGQVDYSNRDPGVPAPNDFNQSMPKAAVAGSANGHLFLGNTKTQAGGYTRGEVKFSDYGFFNRFRSVQDNNDPNSGGRFVCEGETVKQFRTAAAAADNAVNLYVWTDRAFYSVGSPGGYSFAGSSFGVLNLGQKYRISADGTNEPGSIIDHNGVFAWVNSDGHFVLTNGGIPVNISVGNVTNPQSISNASVLDVVADIPASRRGHVDGVYSRNRFIWYMTPSGQTVNARAAIWDDLRKRWECLDTLTNGEVATSIYDASLPGAGQRILLHGTDGKTYAYEEGAGTSAFRLVDRGRMASEVVGGQYQIGCGYTINEVETISEIDTGNHMTLDFYRNMGSSSVQFSMDLGSEATDEWILKATPLSGTPVAGWGGYFDINATMTGGKKISGITAYADFDGADNRAQG